MDLRIYGELWAHISNPHRNANCKCQGLRPRPTHSGHSPRKGRTESLTRKTVHQTQVPAACLYLSSVLCHTGRFCLAFLQGCALLEGRSHQLLAERRQERHEEHLCGGRFEHSQPQSSNPQEQFLQLAFLLLQHYAASAVSTARKSFLPAEAFRFQPCPAPLHGRAGSIPTTTDGVLISQTPAGSRSTAQYAHVPPENRKRLLGQPKHKLIDSSLLTAPSCTPNGCSLDPPLQHCTRPEGILKIHSSTLHDRGLKKLTSVWHEGPSVPVASLCALEGAVGSLAACWLLLPTAGNRAAPLLKRERKKRWWERAAKACREVPDRARKGISEC